MKRSFYALLFLAGTVTIANSQLERTDTLEYRYPTDIVVSAPRLSAPLKELPFSATVVSQASLQQMHRSIAVDEPMKLVPGVKVDNQANGCRVHFSIRGQGILTERGIRGIKILQDGIPLNDPTGFAPDFFDIDFSTVDKIEVLRGQAASLYGGSASGGIVNIMTRQAERTPLFGQAQSTIGSNGFWKGFGEFGGTVQDVNYSVSFSRSLGDGYRDHTHFWGNGIYARATYTPTAAVVLTPIAGWTDWYHENPEGINLQQYEENPKQANPDAIPFNEFLETNRVTTGLTGIILLAPSHEIQFNGYLKRTLFAEANNHTFNHRTILTPGSSVQYTLKQGAPESFIKNSISIGSDLQWQTIDEHRTDNVYTVEGTEIRSRERIKQQGTGVFAFDKVGFGEQWGVMVSIRYDKIRNELIDRVHDPNDLSGRADFSRTTTRIGATFSPAKEVNLYANWGEGFLPPATEELAQNPDHFGGFNTHLVPATSNGVEVGARGSVAEALYYDVTGFFLSTDNDFDRYRITDPLRNQETFYRNAGASRRIGLEVYSRYVPLEKLQIQAAYTYSDFTYHIGIPISIMMDDPSIVKYIRDGNRLPNSPQHQLMLDAQYHVTSDICTGISTETLSKSYIDGANIEAEAVEGYTLVHMRIGYTWHFAGLSGDLTFHVRNIADKKYVAFSEPDPGGNAYQPGSGREFFGGISISL